MRVRIVEIRETTKPVKMKIGGAGVDEDQRRIDAVLTEIDGEVAE